MPSKYHFLNTMTLTGPISIIHVDPEHHLSMEDPAAFAMRDFMTECPLTIESALTINEARSYMHAAHTPVQLVVNHHDEVVGLITLKDLMGRKAMVKANEMGRKLEDVSVKDIMQPTSKLQHVSVKALKSAKVGDVLETLSRLHCEHLLVVEERDSANEQIRGLISATKLAQQLNISVDVSERAQSFSDFVNVVHGHFY